MGRTFRRRSEGRRNSRQYGRETVVGARRGSTVVVGGKKWVARSDGKVELGQLLVESLLNMTQ